jgi:O-glycosyl hydrolase
MGTSGRAYVFEAAPSVVRSGIVELWTRCWVVTCVALASLVFAAPALAGSKPQRFQVVVPGVSAFTATLPADSVATYRWQPGASSVESWVTTPEEAEASEREPGSLTGVVAQSPIPLTSRTTEPEITVEPSAGPLQELTGFGGAMTEAAAYVIDGSSEPRSLIELLFGSPTAGGAGLSIARIPIGPSDFTVTPELPAEEPRYTGENDTRYTVPALKLAREVNPALKLLATPWSAPPGFKIGKEKPGLHANPKSFCAGSNDYLESSRYAEYATYLTEAVSFYESRGLPVWMLSLQNEPHNCNSTYPTMKLEPQDEAELAGYLHTDLEAVKSPPELLGWDHNWNDYNNDPKNSKCKKQGPTSYPETLFSFSPPIQALGFHSYCGTPKAPGGDAEGVPFYVTESTGEGAFPSAKTNLPNEVQGDLIDPLRVGAKGSDYWNLALNEHCGPQYAGTGPIMTEESGRDVCKTPKSDKYTGCVACRPLITVDASGDYRVNQDYYYWAQLSKFFPPDAHVIASSTLMTSKSEGLDSIAAQYPNGTIVLAVLNGANAKAIPAEPNTTPSEGGGARHAIAAGPSHTCLVVTSGSVDCWGSNSQGALGDGSLTGPEKCVLGGYEYPCSLRAILASAVPHATQVAIGDPQSCAVLLSSGVDCWSEPNNATPSPVSGVAEATQVAVGSSFACALLVSGEVKCWGANTLGQLGNGTLAEQTSPTVVSGVQGATQVAAGGEQACALLKSGRVVCWGGDLTGGLGYTPGSSGCPWACTPHPAQVPTVTDAVQISAGEGETCATLSSGSIKCWGENVYGQLGAGFPTSGPETCSAQYGGGYPCSTAPVEVRGITDATTVSAGGQTVCATLTTGAVDCWGFTEGGGLGDGSTEGPDVCVDQAGEPSLCATAPVRVSDIDNASEVSANNTHACALLTTGAVDCWGWNVWGQLGDGTVEASDLPVSVTGLP